MPSVIPQKRHNRDIGQHQGDSMNYAGARCRVYEPEAINTMGRAFDTALKSLSEQSKADSKFRRNLARCIIRVREHHYTCLLSLCPSWLALVESQSARNTLPRYILLVFYSARTPMGGPEPPKYFPGRDSASMSACGTTRTRLTLPAMSAFASKADSPFEGTA